MLTTTTPQVMLNKVQGQWKMSLDGGSAHGPGDYPPIKVPVNDDANLTFTITPASGTTFASDPIWIQKGSAKPTSAGVDSQITGITGQGTTVLKFHDSNADSGDLWYVLKFSDGSTLDPIIDNGGHPAAGTQFTSSTSVTLTYVNLGLMLVAALIIGLALGRLIRR